MRARVLCSDSARTCYAHLTGPRFSQHHCAVNRSLARKPTPHNLRRPSRIWCDALNVGPAHLSRNDAQTGAEMSASQVARRMWTLFEPIHAMTYFAAEARAAYEEAGLRGFWRGYFAGRSAPLGRASAAPVTASFYTFAPQMVGRALPDVWDLITPDQALAVREAGAVAALSRVLRRPERRRRRGRRHARGGGGRPGLLGPGAGGGQCRAACSGGPHALGSGTRRPCSASIAATATSQRWWPPTSTAASPTCSERGIRPAAGDDPAAAWLD